MYVKVCGPNINNTSPKKLKVLQTECCSHTACMQQYACMSQNCGIVYLSMHIGKETCMKEVNSEVATVYSELTCMIEV